MAVMSRNGNGRKTTEERAAEVEALTEALHDKVAELTSSDACGVPEVSLSL